MQQNNMNLSGTDDQLIKYNHTDLFRRKNGNFKPNNIHKKIICVWLSENECILKLSVKL